MRRRGRRRGAGIFGVLLILGMTALLFWNEGRSVARLDALAEGRATVVPVDAQAVDPALSGRLVHLVGRAEPLEPVSDPLFGVQVTALKLERRVEMYQWEEERRGSGESTRYDHRRVWSEQVIDSTRFRDRSYENPNRMPVSSQTWYAPTRLGEYRIGPALLAELPGEASLSPPDPKAMAASVAGQFQRVGDTLYTGDPQSPEIGDLRVRFTQAPPQILSILARQSEAVAGPLLEPHQTESGGTLAMVEPGTLSADAMFALAEERNAIMTWGLRVGGTVGMAIGWALALGSLARLVPVFGGLARSAAIGVALLMAVGLSALIIAGGWLFYRPLTSLVLAGVAVAAFLGLRRVLGRQNRQAAAGSPPQPPPLPPQPPPGSGPGRR